jgi:hypothetical protein
MEYELKEGKLDRGGAGGGESERDVMTDVTSLRG